MRKNASAGQHMRGLMRTIGGLIRGVMADVGCLRAAPPQYCASRLLCHAHAAQWTVYWPTLGGAPGAEVMHCSMGELSLVQVMDLQAALR